MTRTDRRPHHPRGGRALCGLLLLLPAGCASGPDAASGGGAAPAGAQDAPRTARETLGSTAGAVTFDPRGLTTDRFAVAREPVHEYVTADDGTRLAVRIFRPNTASDRTWRTPVILINSPYDNALFNPHVPAAGIGHPGPVPESLLWWHIIEQFTPKGYTVVIAALRGFGRSGGCHDWGGDRAARDYVTLVEHFASRPWTNGRVGGYGISYDAVTQIAGAVRAPRGLATIVPVAGLAGWHDYRNPYGVPVTLALSAWPLYTGTSLFPEPASPSPLPRASALPNCEPHNARTLNDPSGDMTPWYAEREYRDRVGSLQASVLFVQGLADLNTIPINLDNFYDRIPSFHRAIIGQWGHFFPDEVGRNDWRNTLHAWFDHWLLGLDTGVTTWPAVQVQDDHGGWRAVDSYAAMAAGSHDLALGDGALGAAAAPGTTRPLHEPAPLDWVSAPLAAPLHLSGAPSLDLTFALDRPDARVIFELYEEPAQGSGRDPRLLSLGALSARHRQGVANPQPVTTRDALAYRARFLPIDRTIAAGSRLRLVLNGTYRVFIVPSANGYTADIAVDGRSVLHLPVANPGQPLHLAQQ